jgi:ABC transporter DrrB family efflux protein
MPAILVEQVAKRFGDTQALAGVDLEVAPGEVLGLLGPNGAGKTTLVRVLSTLVTPDSGRALVLGRDAVQEPEAVRAAIGLTGQFAAVDGILSGRENLEMFGRLFGLPAREARDRAGELLERFSLADAAGRQAKTYSGGMRRRLDLASSLLTRPEVLFLDEPTTGLDPRSRNEIWGAVRELVAGGTTVLLTTQYLEEADQLADRIVVIDHGRVIAEGTGDALKDRVGGAVLEVQLAEAGERERAVALLRGCGEPQEADRPGLVRLPAPQGDGVALVADVAATLRDAGVAVTDMGLHRPTLDDVFLELTGHEADGEGPPPAPAAQAATARAHRPLHRLTLDPRQIRRALSDIAVVTRRNMRHFVRQPQLLLFSTIQPIMFVLLFAFVFGGAIESGLPAGLDYVDFLLPGIFVQSIAFRASQTAVGLAEDLDKGVVDRFRSMPMARSAVLMGRTVADLARNVSIVWLMAAVGYLVGFRFTGGVLGALGAVAIVGLFSFALSWIFALLGLTVGGAEAAQSAGFVAIFPLVFASSIFVPTETMPDWLAAVADVSPVTYTADAARAMALGLPLDGAATGALLWCGAILAVFVPLCVRRYRRMA